jgi:TfoX/Sxy family transcriptional regulator of competence genes
MARFDAALPDDPACARRQMFGCPAAFVNGNMFACLHQENVIVRLDADARAALQRAGGQAFEPLPGRIMREYLALPAAMLGDPRRLRRWLGRAFAHAGSLPPKHRGRRRIPRRRGRIGPPAGSIAAAKRPLIRGARPRRA